MKLKLLVVVALAALGALGACGKKEAIVQAEAMADAICKCSNSECAMKARIEGTEKLMKHKDDKGSEAEFRAVQAALSRAEICQNKLMASGGPAPAPGAAPGAPGAPAPAPAAPGEPK